SRAGSWPEQLKKRLGRRADGFLAYTDHIKAELVNRGYVEGRIYVAKNTISRPLARAGPREVKELRDRVRLAPDAQVGLYCGQMYPLKRLELLIRAAVLVKRELPRFELILAGAGPTQGICERAAAAHGYIHYIGPVFDQVKVACFELADVCVMPGVVGLGI